MGIGLGLGIGLTKAASGAGGGLTFVEQLAASGVNTDKLISAYDFTVVDGTTVPDQWGSNDIDLTAPTTPNVTEQSTGLRTSGGLIQTPSLTGCRGQSLLYKVPNNDATGFIISGGSASGSGAFEGSSDGTATKNLYTGSGFGRHAVIHRTADNVGSYELNRGGWGLYYREHSTGYNSTYGIGGRVGFTSSRCTQLDANLALFWNDTLTDEELDAMDDFARARGVLKDIYFHREDAPTRKPVYFIIGESNGEGRSLISELSAGDQALDLTAIEIVAENGPNNTNNKDFAAFELGVNQIELSPSTQFGPEFGVAYQADADETSCYIVKTAKGSTFAAPPGTGIVSTATSWTGDKTAAHSSLLFMSILQFQYSMQMLLNSGIGCTDTIRVGFWIGLNDAVSTTYTTDAATYQGYLQAIYDMLVEAFAGATVEMVIFRAHNSSPGSDATALGHVRTATGAFATANANVSVVDTDGYGLNGDNVHYDAAASKAMGITLHG